MKNINNALLDPLIMQSSYVEQGLLGRAPIVARNSSELWYFFINFGIPLFILIIILLVLRMRYNQNKDQQFQGNI